MGQQQAQRQKQGHVPQALLQRMEDVVLEPGKGHQLDGPVTILAAEVLRAEGQVERHPVDQAEQDQVAG